MKKSDPDMLLLAVKKDDPYPNTRRYLSPGRPTIYRDVWTLEMRERVITAFVEEGATISKVLKIMGICRATFYSWMHATGKEDFTETIIRGVELARAWWIEQGQEGLRDKQFNARVYEFMLRNLYGWTGINPQDSLPAGPEGTEGDEAEAVRDTVDIEEIIRQAKANAIEVEYTVVDAAKAGQDVPPAKVKKTAKKASKRRTKRPSKPRALRKTVEKRDANRTRKKRRKATTGKRRG